MKGGKLFFSGEVIFGGQNSKNEKKIQKGRYSRFLPKTLSDFQYQGVVVEV